MAETITFYTLAVLILGLAILVVTVRNTLYSAVLLAVDFLMVALLYASMNSLLMAVIQVMVYAAGIVLIYVVVIILVNLKRPPNSTSIRIATASSEASLRPLSWASSRSSACRMRCSRRRHRSRPARSVP